MSSELTKELSFDPVITDRNYHSPPLGKLQKI